MANLLLICVTLFVPPSVISLNPNPKLLLISMDGFRYDLLKPEYTPNIYKWATQGTLFTSGVRVQYVTYTTTNHMGMTTGLHTESHGIVSNIFHEHDERTNTLNMYDYWNFSKTPGAFESASQESWYFGEPIWITNEKADTSRHSACLQWPMCDAKFRNAGKPAYYRRWTKYQKFEEWLEHIHTIIDLFTRESGPMNFVAWYIDQPDATLHKHGFHDGVIRETMAKLDEVFRRLIEEMERKDLLKEINIILTADHGHAEIEGIKNILCVQDYVLLDWSRLRVGQNMIYTYDKAHAQEIYNNLTKAVKENGLKIKVYWKNEFPDYHFYKGMSSRIGDVILEAEIGYEVDFLCTRQGLNEKYEHGSKKLHSSTHGHDPSNLEMHAVLALSGPDIGNNHKAGRAADIIDLYSLMCFLLKVDPAPNNGSLHRIATNFHLRNYGHQYFNGMLIVAIPLIGLTIIVILCIIVRCVMYQRYTEETEEDIEQPHSTNPTMDA